MKSIRKQLLSVLLIVLTLTWMLVTIITYYESQHEVEEVFDSQMAQSAAVLSQLSSLHLENQPANETRLEKEVYGHRYEKKLSFQVWENGQLALRSANAPDVPMTIMPGYSNQVIDHDKWRIFSLPVGNNKRIYVAEKNEVREELIREITLQALYPLTLALPILVLLIWFSLGHAFKPLSKLAREIDLRSSYNLEPVTKQDNIPSEINPIISALNSLFLQVKSAFEREKRFTSDASHELRTPLASIKIQAQVAMRASNEEQRQHALKQIIQSVDRTTHLVEQMLTLARLDPDAAAEQFIPIDLVQLVRDVVSEYPVQINTDQQTISYHENNETIIIKGNDAALAILLRNLINNALIYSPPRSMVTIETSQTATHAELVIIDQGPGIPKQERTSIFNRFHRGENTQHQQGSGLGLSIVRRIAELHKADIEISDNPAGRGALIRVRFNIEPGSGLV